MYILFIRKCDIIEFYKMYAILNIWQSINIRFYYFNIFIGIYVSLSKDNCYLDTI